MLSIVPEPISGVLELSLDELDEVDELMSGENHSPQMTYKAPKEAQPSLKIFSSLKNLLCDFVV